MMRIVMGNGRGKRTLMTSGGSLIVFSLLVFFFPEFFAYVFAGIVLLLGVGLFLAGLTAPKPPARPRGTSPNTEDTTWEEVL